MNIQLYVFILLLFLQTTLTWGPYLWFHMLRVATSTLSGIALFNSWVNQKGNHLWFLLHAVFSKVWIKLYLICGGVLSCLRHLKNFFLLSINNSCMEEWLENTLLMNTFPPFSAYGDRLVLARECISFLLGFVWNHFVWCYLKRMLAGVTKLIVFLKTTRNYPKNTSSCVPYNELLGLQNKQDYCEGS